MSKIERTPSQARATRDSRALRSTAPSRTTSSTRLRTRAEGVGSAGRFGSTSLEESSETAAPRRHSPLPFKRCAAQSTLALAEPPNARHDTSPHTATKSAARIYSTLVRPRKSAASRAVRRALDRWAEFTRPLVKQGLYHHAEGISLVIPTHYGVRTAPFLLSGTARVPISWPEPSTGQATRWSFRACLFA